MHVGYLLVVALALGLGATAARAGSEPAPCRLRGIKHKILCGSVQRPLDPSQAGARQIEVHYALVPALARRKLADPVVLLAGGPGQSAIALVSSVLPLLQRLNNRRDLIFIDQRGTGRSAPLECDSTDATGMAQQFDPAQQLRLMAECRERLARLPYLGAVDGLRFFTTSIAVTDIEAVRKNLGIQQLNLIGASYGTRVGLEMLRQFPGSVRRAVFDGVAPPDMVLPASMALDSQDAFDALLVACEREADCQKLFPDLRADWQALLSSLPQSTSWRNPRTGRREELVLTREFVLGAVRAPLYQPAIAAALPAAINQAATGRFEPLAALASMVMPDPARKASGGLAAGMHFSVICSEDVPLLPAENLDGSRDFGNSMQRLYRRICADWPRGEVDPAFYRIPVANSAVLLLSGGLDPATPPRHGELVATRLGAKASHRLISNAGHGVLTTGCMRDVVFRFIDAEDDTAALAVDSGCAESIPRPPAFLPALPKAPK